MNAVVPDWRSAGLVKYQGRPNARNSVSGIHEYSHNTLLARFPRSNTRIWQSLTDFKAKERLLAVYYKGLTEHLKKYKETLKPLPALRFCQANQEMTPNRQ